MLLGPISGFFLGDYFSSYGGKLGQKIGKFLFEKNNENDKDKKEE